jgi:putative SOS response-associated peptidase YedK
MHDTYGATERDGRPIPNFPPRYNVRTTDTMPLVRLEDGVRRIDFMRWGLIPIWSKDAKIGVQCVNARGETVQDKPAFRDAFKKRRCIVPADGWVEWTGDRAKQPWLFELSQPFAWAGLWETWTARADEGKPDAQSRVEKGRVYETFTICTSEPSAKVSEIHDREPVALLADQWASWLDPAAPAGALLAMLKPVDDKLVSIRKVSPLINKSGNDWPELLDAVA